MSDFPTISVIVPTYDRAQFLPACIDSLLAQTVPPNEIIVVDDGSSDGSTDALRRYGSAVTIVRKPNGGKSSALNRGLESVRGDLVWILDDDDVALPDALERFVAALLENPDAGFSYSSKYWVRSNPDGTLGEVIGESSVPPVYNRAFVVRLMKGDFMGGAATLVRRSVYEEVGGFDTALMRSQDYEMSIRIAMQYRGVKVAGGPTYMYRQHGGLRGTASVRFSANDRENMWRRYNKIFIDRMHDTLPLKAFSPSETWGDDESERLLAILTRASVMAAHGLHQRVVDDCRYASRSGFGSSAVTEEALATGREITRRYVLEGGDPVNLWNCLRSSGDGIEPLFAVMRRHLIVAVPWSLVPRGARRWIRSRASGRRVVADGVGA